MQARELIERYERGERNFANQDLAGLHLEQAILDGSMFDGADLREAHLEGASLKQVNLESANLESAALQGTRLDGAYLNRTRLNGANLTGAVLADASLERAYLSDAILKHADLKHAVLRRAFLRRADLQEAHLEGADFDEATLVECALSMAQLNNAYLSRTRLHAAQLDGANLHSAVLINADLSETNLRNACLDCANLLEASLANAELSGCTLAGAVLGRTLLLNIDLESLCNAELLHFDSSTVDFASIIRSGNCPRLEQFLKDAGLPEPFLGDVVSRSRLLHPLDQVSSLRHIYLCHALSDGPSAWQLNRHLREHSLTTFFYCLDSKSGSVVDANLARRLRHYDKAIILCSQNALTQACVVRELEELLTIQSSDQRGPELLPVLLDDFVLCEEFTKAHPELAGYFVSSVVADFSEPSSASNSFDDELLGLCDTIVKPRLSVPPPRQSTTEVQPGSKAG